jgi:hypothetical protein
MYQRVSPCAVIHTCPSFDLTLHSSYYIVASISSFASIAMELSEISEQEAPDEKRLYPVAFLEIIHCCVQ